MTIRQQEEGGSAEEGPAPHDHLRDASDLLAVTLRFRRVLPPGHGEGVRVRHDLLFDPLAEVVLPVLGEHRRPHRPAEQVLVPRLHREQPDHVGHGQVFL